MSFVSYPHLILQISGQTLQVTVASKNFWELNELSGTFKKKITQYPSHRIFGHMYKILNAIEKITNYIV